MSWGLLPGHLLHPYVDTKVRSGDFSLQISLTFPQVSPGNHHLLRVSWDCRDARARGNASPCPASWCSPLFPQALPSGPAPDILFSQGPRSPRTGDLILAYQFDDPFWLGAELSGLWHFKHGIMCKAQARRPSVCRPPKLVHSLLSSGHAIFPQMYMPSICQLFPLTTQTFTGWQMVLFFMLRMKPRVLYMLGKNDAWPGSPPTRLAFNFFRAPWLWLGLQVGTNKTSGFCFFLFFCLLLLLFLR